MNQPIESTPSEAIGAIDVEIRSASRVPRVSRFSDTLVEITAFGAFDAAIEDSFIDDLVSDDPIGSTEDIPQWPRVLDLLLDELIAGAGEAEAQPFLHRVGMRLAKDLSLGQPATLAALEAAINRRLSQLDWGWCSIRDAERYLIIEHGDYPLMGARCTGASGHQRLAGLSWILCGLYQGWLAALGGHASASCQRSHAHQTLIFHYGSA